MSLKIIVSYDDTDNDRDALALGRLFASAGAELSLAYVRHSFGESLEQEQAELGRRLAEGEFYRSDPDQVKAVTLRYREIEDLLSVLLTRWEELEERKRAAAGSA